MISCLKITVMITIYVFMECLKVYLKREIDERDVVEIFVTVGK